MEFKTYIGTKVFFGKGCLGKNKSELKGLGVRCFIVTGKTSGKASGALEEITRVFDELEILYYIYDKISNNPSFEDISKATAEAKEWKADFIVGIGGGSPLDAAKAVAVMAVNDMEVIDLYKNVFTNLPLPIVAIPTTAGTGSEVTPYAILSRDDLQTKMSFGNDSTFPKMSFIDPQYTMSMPYDITVNTALDAFTHALEGYLSKRSVAYSDMLATEAIKIFGECLQKLSKREFDIVLREKLMYLSMLAGMVISHTGTTIMHGLGYNLTYFYNVPHGLANVYFMGEYLVFNYENSREKIDNVLSLLGVTCIDEFMDIVDTMFEKNIIISNNEIEIFADITMKQRSTGQNIRNVSKEDLCKIIENSLRIKSKEVSKHG